MNALALTAADRREMVARALLTCPDLSSDDAVVEHLHRLGLTMTLIDRDVADLIDEARAARRADTFTPLGDAAAAVVRKLTPST